MKYVDTEMDDVDSVSLNRYRKKNKDESSSRVIKTKHNHEYEYCMLNTRMNEYYRAEYCIHCGKIHNVFLFEQESYGNGYYKQLSQQDVKKKWADLKIFHVDGIEDTVVNLDE